MAFSKFEVQGRVGDDQGLLGGVRDQQGGEAGVRFGGRGGLDVVHEGGESVREKGRRAAESGDCVENHIYNLNDYCQNNYKVTLQCRQV